MPEKATCELTIDNRVAELERLAEEVATFARSHAIPDQIVTQVTLALEEIVTNVIEHGYEGTEPRQIAVRLSLADAKLTVEVEDEGGPFNPLEAAEPDLDLPLDERPIGGLGILLTRRMMDNLAYARTGNKNILTMEKRIDR